MPWPCLRSVSRHERMTQKCSVPASVRVGAEQQLHHRLGPLLAGDFLHIDQFGQQVGIA